MPELKSQAKWEAGSQRPEVSTPIPNLRQPTWCSPTWGSHRSYGWCTRAEASEKGAQACPGAMVARVP